MKIYIDADACPVIPIVLRVAKEKSIPVILVYDTSHVFNSSYCETIIVDKGADSADFKLVALVSSGDIVVTQDYGVAAMVLGKGGHPIHQSGKWYTNENIDIMMMERDIAKRERRKNAKNHLKGPKKRTINDDLRFEEKLRELIVYSV